MNNIIVIIIFIAAFLICLYLQLLLLIKMMKISRLSKRDENLHVIIKYERVESATNINTYELPLPITMMIQYR